MTMRRTILLLLVLLAPCASPVFAWGSATHAYIADHIGSRVEGINNAEAYGAMVPDLFQSDMDLAFDPLLSAYTHGTWGHELFLAPWLTARMREDRASGYGWASHNDVWGADSTAHDPISGYVVHKAAELDAAMAADGVWDYIEQQLGFPLPDADRLLFCHIVVETDGDILMKGADPKLGEHVIGAALLGAPQIATLLVDSLEGADAATVRTMEDRFRRYMYFYGGSLAQDDDEAIELLSHDVTRQALAYLAWAHPELTVDDFQDLVDRLAHFAMLSALPLMDDYIPAVQETILSVSSELAAHHVMEGGSGNRAGTGKHAGPGSRSGS
jgi:hypothetical protein